MFFYLDVFSVTADFFTSVQKEVEKSVDVEMAERGRYVDVSSACSLG